MRPQALSLHMSGRKMYRSLLNSEPHCTHACNTLLPGIASRPKNKQLKQLQSLSPYMSGRQTYRSFLDSTPSCTHTWRTLSPAISSKPANMLTKDSCLTSLKAMKNIFSDDSHSVLFSKGWAFCFSIKTSSQRPAGQHLQFKSQTVLRQKN